MPWSCTWGVIVAIVVGMLGTAPARAGDADGERIFAEQVVPILENRCIQCHDTRGLSRGGLSLNHAAEVLGEGSEGAGPVVVPGDPDRSILIRSVTGPDPKMPDRGEPLTDAEVAALRTWVEAGAPWPEQKMLVDRFLPGRDLWSLKSIETPSVPDVAEAHRDWPESAIDYFVLAKLEEAGLEPGEQANRRTLIRRAYFDLLGLPPTPEQVDAFANDPDPHAYERLSEAEAKQVAQRRGSPVPSDDLRTELTGVNVNTPTAVDHPSAQDDRPLIDAVFIPDGRAADGGAIESSSTGQAIPAVPGTSGAAWDAIRNGPVHRQHATTIADRDYAAHGRSMLGLHANAAITFDLAHIRAAHEQPLDTLRTKVAYGGTDCGTAADYAVYVDGHRQAFGRLSGEEFDRLELAIAPEARFLTLMATEGDDGIGCDQIYFAEPWLLNRQSDSLGEKTLAELEGLEQRRAEIGEAIDELSEREVYAIRPEQPEEIAVLERGNPEQPGEVVTPGALSTIEQLDPDLGDGDMPEGERRRALAEWITDPAHPLTRRVIVNRLWHYHFGLGIVNTPSDFGMGGDRPSHPQLLDYLAEQLLAEDWSLKAIHREIMLSATYRQAGRAYPEAEAIDAENRLLWRAGGRRLEAEAVRDAVLAVSGKLNLDAGGPGYRDFQFYEEYAPVYDYITADEPALWRRTVYRFVVRSTPEPFLTTLDCPNPATLTPARLTTTTALQSLAMLNNAFILKQAEYFADRVEREAGPDTAAQVQRAFELAFQRAPDPSEQADAETLVRDAGLFHLCRMLLNANEFSFID